MNKCINKTMEKPKVSMLAVVMDTLVHLGAFKKEQQTCTLYKHSHGMMHTIMTVGRLRIPLGHLRTTNDATNHTQ